MEDFVYYNNLYDIYGDLLTENEQNCFIDYYQDNLSLSEIAENKNVSRSAIGKTIKNVTDKYIGKQIASLPPAELQAGLLLFGIEPKDVQQYIDSRYSVYNQPLTPKETQKIAKALVKQIMDYDISNGVMKDKRTQAILKCVSDNLKSAPKLRNAFTETLAKTISKKNGDCRAFLLSDSDNELLDAKAEIFFIKYLNNNQNVMYPLMAVDKDTLDKYIAPIDRGLYNYVMQYRLLQSVRHQ